MALGEGAGRATSLWAAHDDHIVHGSESNGSGEVFREFVDDSLQVGSQIHDDGGGECRQGGLRSKGFGMHPNLTGSGPRAPCRNNAEMALYASLGT